MLVTPVDMTNSNYNFLNYVQRKPTFLSEITEYEAALYLRLSRDDNLDDMVSISILNQEKMLRDYAKEKGYKVVAIYKDDGITGTTFNRPGFKKMIDDMYKGKFNMIIINDLSRLGRDHANVGLYLGNIFPQNRIRLLSLHESYDSENKSTNQMAPFINIMNEWFARQTSEKCKAVKLTMARNGEFTGSIPPYGYNKGFGDNKNKLYINKISCEIVRRIYNEYANGQSARSITNGLNNDGLMTPQNFYYHQLGKENPYKKNKNYWCSGTIDSILENMVYLGHMVQHKRMTEAYNSKNMIELPPENWIIVLNTHEAIVDNDLWIEVQKLKQLHKNRKARITKHNNDISLFSGLLKCMDCHSNMQFSSAKRVSKIDQFYRCQGYNQGRKCTPHRIQLDFLEDIVLKDIKKNAILAEKDQDAFIQSLFDKNLAAQKTEDKENKKKIQVQEERLNELDSMIQKVFEKNIVGIINDTTLSTLIAGYENEKSMLNKSVGALKAKILENENNSIDLEKEIKKLMDYVKIEKLNRKIVTSLIDCIYISEPRYLNEVDKVYDIQIEYKFKR